MYVEKFLSDASFESKNQKSVHFTFGQSRYTLRSIGVKKV